MSRNALPPPRPPGMGHMLMLRKQSITHMLLAQPMQTSNRRRLLFGRARTDGSDEAGGRGVAESEDGRGGSGGLPQGRYAASGEERAPRLEIEASSSASFHARGTDLQAKTQLLATHEPFLTAATPPGDSICPLGLQARRRTARRAILLPAALRVPHRRSGHALVDAVR